MSDEGALQRRRVLLDTNALHLPAPLTSNPERLLLDAARRRQIELVVPELVIREVVNKWRELARKHAEEILKSAGKLAEFGLQATAPDAASIDERGEAVEAEIRSKLRVAGAQVPSFPNVSHEEVVQRALDRRQPFDNHGKDGYRDALLWHVVLDLAAEGNVTLISNDIAAFGHRGKEHSGQLSPSLGKELDCLAGDRSRVTWIHSLRALADELQQVDLRTLTELRQLLRYRSMHVLIEEALENVVPGADLSFSALRAFGLDSSAAESAYLSDIGELGAVRALRAYRLPSDDALVELDITAGIELTVFFSSAAAAQAVTREEGYETLDSQVWRALDDRHYIATRTARLAHLRVDASVKLPEGRLDRLDLVDALPAGAGEVFEKPETLDDDADEEDDRKG